LLFLYGANFIHVLVFVEKRCVIWLIPSKGLLLYVLVISNHPSTSFNACSLCILNSEAADLTLYRRSADRFI